jgi:hypothetical protein
MREPDVVEVLGRPRVHLVRHEALRQDGHRLRQRQRRPLAPAVEVLRFLPGVEELEAVLGLAVLAGQCEVHVETERAVVELGGADHDEFGERGLAEPLLRGGAQRGQGPPDRRVEHLRTLPRGFAALRHWCRPAS